MAATSRVPALYTALVDLCLAAPGYADVQIYSAPIALEQTAPESIQFDDATPTQAWGALGNKARDEEFDLGLTISVVVPGGGEEEMTAARDRVFALLAVLELLLRTDPSAGGSVRVAHVTSAPLTQIPTPQGRMAILSVTVHASARLTI